MVPPGAVRRCYSDTPGEGRGERPTFYDGVVAGAGGEEAVLRGWGLLPVSHGAAPCFWGREVVGVTHIPCPWGERGGSPLLLERERGGFLLGWERGSPPLLGWERGSPLLLGRERGVSPGVGEGVSPAPGAGQRGACPASSRLYIYSGILSR